MLPDQLYQLLTAYVDGELSSRQCRAVLRLLRKSPEARTLLRQLQNDAQAARGLPRLHLPGDFSRRVLQAIGERGLKPAQPARPATPPPSPWLGWAAAAAVFLAVCTASFLFFSA